MIVQRLALISIPLVFRPRHPMSNEPRNTLERYFSAGCGVYKTWSSFERGSGEMGTGAAA